MAVERQQRGRHHRQFIIRADLLAYTFGCTLQHQERDKGLPSEHLYHFDDWRGQQT